MFNERWLLPVSWQNTFLLLWSYLQWGHDGSLMLWLVQFSHAESRTVSQNIILGKCVIEEKHRDCLQTPSLFYGFWVATIKVYALHKLYQLSPEAASFSHTLNSPVKFLVKYCCFQKPALRPAYFIPACTLQSLHPHSNYHKYSRFPCCG